MSYIMLQMKPGILYRLRNLKKNKHETCMTNHKGTLVTCRAYGWPGNNRRYTDGDVFLCVAEDAIANWQGRTTCRAYKLLTPAGDVVRVWRDGNKTKFREVK